MTSCSSSLICNQDNSCCIRISAHQPSCCALCSLHDPPVQPPPQPEELASAAISPAAGFGFHGVPFNVMRNSKSQRSNSGRLRTFLVLYTPLVVMISISSLRSLMPMNAPSCHLGSNFACLAPPGRIGMKYSKFNQLSAVRLTSMQFVSCAPVTTNLIP